MAEMNIIPYKIPVQIWENKKYEDAILYILGVYGPMRREEFINSSEKGISNRMNKNTFHKWARKLKSKNFINVTRDQKNSIYSVTSLGVKELIKRLKSYRLDIKTILNLEQKVSTKNLDQINQFLNLFNIKDINIVIEFLKIRNELPTENLKSFSEDKLNISILYLTLNHVKFFDEAKKISISLEDFIKKYGKNKLTKMELKWFLHQVVVKEACFITFYEVKLSKENIILYFRSTDEYGTIFKAIIQSILRSHYYLGIVDSNNFKEIIINDLCEEILFELIKKYNLFHESLEIPLFYVIRNYLIKMFKDFKKKYFFNYLNLKEIPALILTSDIYIFERLDYLQKKAITCLKEANKEIPHFKHDTMVNNSLEYVDKAIDLNTKNSLNYAIKTQILQFNGEYNKALKNIKKAIEINPEVANYHINLANILMWKNKYEKAIEAINRAIEIDPSVPQYYSNLASVYCFLDMYEKALEVLNTAINIAPTSTQLYLQKARYLAFYLKKNRDALKILEDILNPELEKDLLFEIYSEQAGILFNMKKNEAALEIIKKARKIYPNKIIYPNIHK
ncbi:MAG: tetratricopeptide repeat protein [Promethearchaeota archaeon]